MNVVGYIATVCLISGMYLIGKKNIYGLYLNLLGSIIFMSMGFFVWNNTPIGITNIFMTWVNVLAIKNWRRNEH